MSTKDSAETTIFLGIMVSLIDMLTTSVLLGGCWLPLLPSREVNSCVVKTVPTLRQLLQAGCTIFFTNCCKKFRDTQLSAEARQEKKAKNVVNSRLTRVSSFYLNAINIDIISCFYLPFLFLFFLESMQQKKGSLA